MRSPAPGIVTFAGAVAGRPVMVVSHGAGLRSTFEPVHATAAVGTPVVGGQPIAVLSRASGSPGVSHCMPNPCLHWGVLSGSAYLDPLTLLAVDRVVLLPMH